jgi:hypothetical protein
METCGVRNEKIKKKPETISRPEQERDTINKSLLSVQKLSQKENRRYMVVFNAEKESRGREYAERRPHS